jgi:hypothetical protein
VSAGILWTGTAGVLVFKVLADTFLLTLLTGRRFTMLRVMDGRGVFDLYRRAPVYDAPDIWIGE